MPVKAIAEFMSQTSREKVVLLGRILRNGDDRLGDEEEAAVGSRDMLRRGKDEGGKGSIHAFCGDAVGCRSRIDCSLPHRAMCGHRGPYGGTCYCAQKFSAR